MEPRDQLQQLFRELFQLDNTDLDFGIYRVLNLKSKEVNAFITDRLPKRVEEVKERILARQSIDLKNTLESLKSELATDFKVNFDLQGDLEAKAGLYRELPLFRERYNRYVESKKQLDALRVSVDTERSIYNELYRFFDRYYEGGDFISKPRAGKDAYMIPYSGDEVKLYWANHDQYYIRTSENYRNYVFTNNSPDPDNLVTVEFKLVDADISGNNKDEKDRRFVPTETPFDWDAANRKLTVSFFHKVPSADEKARWGEKQNVKTENKGINQRLYANLEKFVVKAKDAELMLLWAKTRKNSKGEDQPIFQYHLHRYTDCNTFDYFIHKDLRGFLTRELDYFLKNEVLGVNFLEPDWKETEVQEAIKLNVLKASAIRDLAMTVIDFLGELEDFQKRLWEKKKFVVQSEYCLTLDLIGDEGLLNEIVEFILHDHGKKQIQEWIQLGFIESKKDLKDLRKSLREAENRLRYLVLDTQFLTSGLKGRLLSSFENFDARLNGVLINSENWQALNLLRDRYPRGIKCVYIDPPYNAKSSEIVYKNSYKHSSWLAMMQNRLLISKRMLGRDGLLIVAIDENEHERLGLLLDEIFPERSKTCVTVLHNPSGQQGDNFSYCHEYAFFVYPKGGRYISMEVREDDEDTRNFRDVTGDESLRESAATCFYPILIKDGKIIGFGAVCDDAFHPPVNIPGDGGVIEVYPVDPQGIERKWRYGRQTVESIQDELDVKFIKRRKVWDIIRTKSEFNYKTVWADSKYSANNHGTQLLNHMFGKVVFSYPKSLYTVLDALTAATKETPDALILDYFAGSATTAHATIELNKKSASLGARKYLLAEIANYFDTATKPRVQKAVFSDKWSNGKPNPEGKGTSQMFHYLKLEQYEDTLNNIVFRATARQLSLEDQLRYEFTYGVQGSDCLLNVGKFTNPFGYTMSIIRQNEIVPDQPIDLVTTFNFFLGIEVNRYVIEQHQRREYRIVLCRKRQQEYIIVWRAFDEDRLDLTKERDWVQRQRWFNTDAIIFCNGDNAFGAQSTEGEFKRIMNEPVL
jgi:adenine-specific DNA-methyltransferase